MTALTEINIYTVTAVIDEDCPMSLKHGLHYDSDSTIRIVQLS